MAEADLFNVMNKQTGYNFEPARNNSAFGTPRRSSLRDDSEVNMRLQF